MKSLLELETMWQQCCMVDQEAALLAEAKSPFGVRILRVDADMEQQLLVCGDRMGNVVAFHFDAACLSSPGLSLYSTCFHLNDMRTYVTQQDDKTGKFGRNISNGIVSLQVVMPHCHWWQCCITRTRGCQSAW